jgi:hypothetical protein
MKKQILILIIALFALGLTNAVAQVVLTPTPLGDCIDLDDPLNVVPGQEYTYKVNVPTPPGPHTYHWFVTQDTEFIENGGGIIAAIEPNDGSSPVLASGQVHYNTQSSIDSINLEWYSFILDPGEYVFVGIFVEDVNGCSNNLKVYRIRPVHAFTLDLANVNFVGNTLGGDDFAQCVSDIESAIFDPNFGADGGIVYDFGENTLYYVVAAAYFSTSYRLQAIFNGLADATPSGTLGQTAMIYWDYTLAGLTANPNGQAITNGATITVGNVNALDSPVGAAGEMIFIKIVISNNHYELTTDTDYSFAVDGVLYDSGGILLNPAQYGDIHYANCVVDGFDNDVVNQVITARPTINSVSPVPPGYLPIAP